ncbi:MAG: LTA synthase family protein [Chitinispirillaceae bacterium]|nr:LTA synthase family protein [Chitinispirillaceae bacterium]
MRQWALLVVCVLSAPVMVRIALLLERGNGFQSNDICGFLSDIVISLFFLPLFLVLAKYTRIVSLAVLLAWCLFNYSNYEHVLANGDIVSLRYANHLFDTTFLFGSALTVSNPVLIALTILLPLLIFFVIPHRTNPVILSVLFVLAFVGLQVNHTSASVLVPRWRSFNVLHANVADMYDARFHKRDHAPDSISKKRYSAVLAKNVSGTPIARLGNKNHNVLIVIVESFCGGMLPSLREPQHMKSDISMHRLDSIAGQNMVYTNFISHQRQTNRGVFSILSGSYPKLNSSTPKMTEYVTIHNMNEACGQQFLPRVLSQYGYETTYLQAAPLPYMLKDVFMKLAGFEHAYGTDWFTYHYSLNYWGVDDKAFFEQAFSLIDSKRALHKPWFMTLLTVGTHHPLNIPDDYGDQTGELKSQRAYRYLDEALASFIEKLGSSGFLENTLVIITSDESRGINGIGNDAMEKRLCQQWGLLTVLHPEKKSSVVTTPFSQYDLALSVVDYLGLPLDDLSFNGRSIFRTYHEPRDIYFGNTYNHFIGRFTGNNTLEICNEHLTQGEIYEFENNALFSLDRKLIRKMSPEEIFAIADFDFFNNRTIIGREAEQRAFDFRSGVTHTISDDRQHTILGGQFFSIPKNSAVSVSLKGRIISRDSCTVFLKHDLSAKSGQIRITKYMPKTVTQGDHFFAIYDFYSPDRYTSVEYRVTAQLKSGTQASLILDQAALSYVMRPPTPSERKKYFTDYDKNVGRDVGASMQVSSAMATAALSKN